MGETMRRHVAERGRKSMEKEGGVTTDDLKNDMKRLMSLMDTSEEVAEAQKQVRQNAPRPPHGLALGFPFSAFLS